MKSKEEILKEQIGNTPIHENLRVSLLWAMQEYADQQSEAMAVEFAGFLRKMHHEGNHVFGITNGAKELFTNNQLFQKFKNDKGV